VYSTSRWLGATENVSPPFPSFVCAPQGFFFPTLGSRWPPFDDDENEEAIACLWQFEVRVDVLVLTCRMYEEVSYRMRHRGHRGHSATNGQRRKDGSERHVDCKRLLRPIISSCHHNYLAAPFLWSMGKALKWTLTEERSWKTAGGDHEWRR
jgi:hypothetical protein